jgi:ubiquinone biosynthesis protein
MGHYPVSMEVEELYLPSNLDELLRVARHNHIQLPSNTFLLFKTMAILQSLGTKLDPDFDLFSLLTPHIERIFRKKYAPSTILHQLPLAAGDLALFGFGLPKRIARIVRNIERGEMRIRTDVTGVEQHLGHLERLVNRMIIGIIVAAVIIGLALYLVAYRLGG